MRYRELLFEGRDAPLFHGTDLVSAISITRHNQIDANQQYEHHPRGVSLARDYLVARAFGTYFDRVVPVVFVLDQQQLLNSNLKLRPYRDTSEPGVYRERESEELVLGDIASLDRYLISINVDMKQLRKAATNRGYQDWCIDEYGWVNHLPFLKNRRTFVTAINKFSQHPKLNVWVPRVTAAKGTEHDGDVYED